MTLSKAELTRRFRGWGSEAGAARKQTCPASASIQIGSVNAIRPATHVSESPTRSKSAILPDGGATAVGDQYGPEQRADGFERLFQTRGCRRLASVSPMGTASATASGRANGACRASALAGEDYRRIVTAGVSAVGPYNGLLTKSAFCLAGEHARRMGGRNRRAGSPAKRRPVRSSQNKKAPDEHARPGLRILIRGKLSLSARPKPAPAALPASPATAVRKLHLHRPRQATGLLAAQTWRVTHTCFDLLDHLSVDFCLLLDVEVVDAVFETGPFGPLRMLRLASFTVSGFSISSGMPRSHGIASITPFD